MAGEWRMVVDWSGAAPARFVKRAYSRNPVSSLGGGVRYPSVLPGKEIYVYGYPRSTGGSVTDPGKKITATVHRPDGSLDVIELNDMGRSQGGGGDDISGDGIFTGVYTKTNLSGTYEFNLRTAIDKWIPSESSHKNTKVVSERFNREMRLYAAVGNPGETDPTPDDGAIKRPPKTWWKWAVAVLVLLLLLLLLSWWMGRRKK